MFILFNSYYIGLKVNDVNRRISEIKLPTQLKRNLRPLSEKHFYKASEWRTLLLHVAVPVLENILPDRYTHSMIAYLIL